MKTIYDVLDSWENKAKSYKFNAQYFLKTKRASDIMNAVAWEAKVAVIELCISDIEKLICESSTLKTKSKKGVNHERLRKVFTRKKAK